MLENENILVTGSTGLLGSRITQNLLLNTSGRIFLLVRGNQLKEAQNRVKKILKLSLNSPDFKKITILLGDITKPNMGIKKSFQRILKRCLTQIYHCAALTSFTEKAESLQKVNELGIKNVLTFALKCKLLKSIEYVSTAFIVGQYRGKFTETDFNKKQKFNNFYEKSKFRAEQYLITHSRKRNDIPLRIYRPGVIVGDYPTGEVMNPGLLYKLFRLLILKTMTRLPVSQNARLNLVPSNVAAEMITKLASLKPENSTFHILMPQNFHLSQIIKEASKHLKIPCPKLLSLKNFMILDTSPVERKILEPFVPYFQFAPNLDIKRTTKALRLTKFQYPKLTKKFIHRLINFYYSKYVIKE